MFRGSRTRGRANAPSTRVSFRRADQEGIIAELCALFA